jgi:MULE transposase domain
VVLLNGHKQSGRHQKLLLASDRRPPKTPADKLLEQFDSDENLSHVALFAEMKSDQLTIKKKRKHKNIHSIAELTEEELISVQDSTDSAKLHVSKIRESLRISNKVNKILLAFAWTDTESKIRFDMFPSILVADCTHSLNKEERPVMIFAGIDSHNATHSHTWVFLPSEARWVFSWVLNSALPQLHNRNTLVRVRLFVTDQDGQLNFVADNSLGPGSKFLPTAQQRQTLQNEYSNHHPSSQIPHRACHTPCWFCCLDLYSLCYKQWRLEEPAEHTDML